MQLALAPHQPSPNDTDAYRGDPLATSALHETDFVPVKPRCDLLLSAKQLDGQRCLTLVSRAQIPLRRRIGYPTASGQPYAPRRGSVRTAGMTSWSPSQGLRARASRNARRMAETAAHDRARTRTARLGRCSRADAGLGSLPTARPGLRAPVRLGSAHGVVAAVSLRRRCSPTRVPAPAAPQTRPPAPHNARACTAPDARQPRCSALTHGDFLSYVQFFRACPAFRLHFSRTVLFVAINHSSCYFLPYGSFLDTRP